MNALNRPFKSVLVANRGEIARRIIEEAKVRNFLSIAVFSDADRDAYFRALADRAIRIGAASAAESYLNGEKILGAARQSNAEAIHPGYGFLAENADFAQRVIDAGLVWIGPSPNAIRAMGDKGAAKKIARNSDVPVIPGYDGDDQSDALLLGEAKKIGWPVLIKAANGGGGRGQRKVASEGEFTEALAAARRESLSAFASDKVILERALEHVRHVEVQVFGDAHGNIIQLGERDCSVQRRNQKLIEEAPAPGVSEDLRARMGDAAVRLARAVAYTNAGTVEFLLDRDEKFYFLEMNTRIQVEHPVTEEVTGLNLVRMQFDVAMGKPLPKQEEIRFAGHAIEARICAEDPDNGFAPQSGKMVTWFSPQWGRTDSSLSFEGTVPPDYDSLLAKLIVRGETRDEARRQLVRALEDLTALGVKTNRNYLISLLEQPAFASGTYALDFVSSVGDTSEPLDSDHATIAALILAYGAGKGWNSTGVVRTSVRLRARNSVREFQVQDDASGVLHLVSIDASDPSIARAIIVDPEGTWNLQYIRNGNRIQIQHEGTDEVFEDVTYAPAEPKDAAGDGAVRAPMAGKIVRVNVEPGAHVEKGQVLVILEAMKMEHEIVARAAGTVAAVNVKQGDQAAARQVLVTLN